MRTLKIPVETLADWLRIPTAQPEAEPTDSNPDVTRDATLPRVETLLDAWERWSASFTDFCQHVRFHLRIDWGRTLIAHILEQHGVRLPRRRPGRSPDEKALRLQFETFFPGAQWVGDGSPIAVAVSGQCFLFSLELIVDPDSGAFAGFDIRDEEDADAVTHAFADAVRTTGQPPLALLLDNRPSNHTATVLDALGDDTLLIPATLGRAQNKAHAEGAFGLFQQTAPPLVLLSQDPRYLARELLALIVQAWARTLNHRPRSDRNGRSRVQLYLDAAPTPDQIEQARASLRHRLRKQQLANQTRRRRLDPAVRHALDLAFERLHLADPHGHLKDAIAAYPHDDVLAAIATFEGKRNAGTLPHGADARYLLGITRNLAYEHEGFEIAQALWRQRLAARDHALLRLDSLRNQIHNHHTDPDDPSTLVNTFVDKALASQRRLDRFFWLQAAVDAATPNPNLPLEPLFRAAARRIHATHSVPHRDRLAATRFLAAKLLPLDRLQPNT